MRSRKDSTNSFGNLLNGGVRRLALTYNLQLLAKRVLLRGQRHELFMPEPQALGLGKRGHRVHDGNLSLRELVDLTHEANDLGHLLPGFRMMPPAPSFKVQPPAVTVAFARQTIKLRELLQLQFILLLDWFNLCVRADEVVRRRKIRIFDTCDLPPEHS
jgi:hypothetical protein